MHKYSSVAISGQIGSGTTTIAKALHKTSWFQSYRSAGDFFRQYSLEQKIPLWDKDKIPEAFERMIDENMVKALKHRGTVVDGHYIGYLSKDLPQVLKVRLTCNTETRIKRVLARTHTHKETVEEIKLREQGLDKKFRSLYSNEDYLNPKFFDIEIDTTDKTEKEIVDEIIEKFNSTN